MISLPPPQNKKRRSKGKAKKTSAEESRADDGGEDDGDAMPALRTGAGREGGRDEGETLSNSSAPSFYPSWKRSSSDSEFSDPEGSAQSKLRHRMTFTVLLSHFFSFIFAFFNECKCLFLFQAVPRPGAPGSAALSAGGGEERREEDSVRLLVLLHP